MKQMKALNYNFKINSIKNIRAKFDILDKDKINIINVDFKFNKFFDKISNKSNTYISKCFEIALNLLKNGKCLGLINGPVSKKNFLKNKFLGITEYLADHENKKNNVVMLIYNKKLSVSPITTHLPLKSVHKYLSRDKIIKHVKIIRQFYKEKFKKNPKIAITGLNPHCESNYKSSEEDRIIKPAIKHLQKLNYKVKGPYAADTIFMLEQSKHFDVIIGMYHDQVLGPAKTLFGFNAINISLGLPYIRITPDHGPNSAMLGKNKSNPQSLIEAFKFFENK